MQYKCKNCGDIRNIITVGDTKVGCANCGIKAGFLEIDENNNEKEHEISEEDDIKMDFIMKNLGY